MGVFVKGSSTALILVALGAAYLLTKPKTSDSPTTNLRDGSYEMAVASPTGQLSTRTIRTPKEGITAINESVASGSSIPSTGIVLVKQNTTFVDDAGNKYHTGANQTVVKLGSYSEPKVITVNQPNRDAQGKTAFDRIIEKNKSLDRSLRDTRDKKK